MAINVVFRSVTIPAHTQSRNKKNFHDGQTMNFKNYLNSGNYGSLSTQSRYQAAQSYNASISSGFSSFSSHGGGSSLAGTHWVLSNGTVVTWEGQVISGPTSK